MRIRIQKHYQNTSGQQVQPGDYDASDLPGELAQYLVDNGHAERIDNVLDTQEVEPIEPEESAASVSLDEMTKAELIDYADANDIDINVSDKKAEIYAAIVESLSAG